MIVPFGVYLSKTNSPSAKTNSPSAIHGDIYAHNIGRNSIESGEIIRGGSLWIQLAEMIFSSFTHASSFVILHSFSLTNVYYMLLFTLD